MNCVIELQIFSRSSTSLGQYIHLLVRSLLRMFLLCYGINTHVESINTFHNLIIFIFTRPSPKTLLRHAGDIAFDGSHGLISHGRCVSCIPGYD